MTSNGSLPLLLPPCYLPSQEESKIGWRPTRNLEVPNPPPPEDPRALEMDMARQLADGKPVKKVHPRRTVDYAGAMGRWALVSASHIPGPMPAWLMVCRLDAQNATKFDVRASTEARAAVDHRCRGGLLLGMYGIQRLNISRVQLLPPKAYPNNPSTSLCTKFVHTSTNKIRCPVNCVVVSASRNTFILENPTLKPP